MNFENISLQEQEAFTSVKIANLRKKINAQSWNDNMENLIKIWGEKAAGLRFMHNNSAESWKNFSNTLTLSSICITTIASGASLIVASIDDKDYKNTILYISGILGIISTFIQSLKKFYNAEEKSADHTSIARQFGSFYRFITLQMNLNREERLSSDKLSEQALKEFERLHQESPPISIKQIELFRKTFADSEQAFPDICEKKFNIKIYNKSYYSPNIISLDKINSDTNSNSTTANVVNKSYSSNTISLDKNNIEIDIETNSNLSELSTKKS
jgi:hypothetical protein